MRKVTLLFSLLLLGFLAFAQDVIVVEPDLENGGAINKAVEENGPGKIYQLKVNSYYVLSGTLELLADEGNPDLGYQFVGEVPASDDDFMPVIQTGLTIDNLPFQNMFNAKADVSFENIFIANQTIDGQIGNQNILVQDAIDLTMDNCVVDPVGRNSLIQGSEFSIGSNLYVTNNLILRHGDEYGPNGGHLIWDVFSDTLIMENNSIITTDQNVIAGGDDTRNYQFVWFNHNTVVFHDVRVLPNNVIPETYVTNNLYYDLTAFVQQHPWAAADPDHASTGTYPCLVKQDTAMIDGAPEPLPSTRTSFWNANSLYVSEAEKSVILDVAANDPEQNQLWQYPVIWNEDVPEYFVTNWDDQGQAILDASREAKLFESDDFPNFVEANTHYDENPDFVNPKVDEHSVDVANSALFWYYANALLAGENPEVQASQFWDVDGWAGTEPSAYPTVWPRWNGTYTNATLLTASNAGLPLGDLNAFPEEKAIYEYNRTKIEDHILGLNTEQMTDIETPVAVDEKQLSAGVSIYPNPVNNILYIESAVAVADVSIYSITGSLVHKVNSSRMLSQSIDISELAQGMYIVRLGFENGESFSTKLTKK